MAVSRVARLALGAALLALGGLTLTAPSAERPPRAPRGGRAERVLAEEAELPTPKTWRELRRHPRFDHSPGSGWRTQLLPDKEASDPRRVQEGLTRAERLSGVLRVLDGADLSSWSAINVATAWHRLAKFSRLPKRGAAPDQRDLQIRDLQRRLAERARELGPEEFTPRSISTLFYAWGLKRFKCKLLKPFSISARTRLKEFDPQSIANMVFGMGLLGLQYEDRLLEEVGKQVPQRLIEFQLEEVISMFYSLGKLRYSPAEGKLLAAMGDYVIDRIDTLGPTRLLKVVEAANQVDFPKSRLMNVLMNQIAREINGFTVHQIVVLVRSCAQAEVKHAKGTTAITEEVMSRLSELNTDARLSQIMDNLKIMQDLVRKKKKKEEVELTQ